MPKKIFDKGTHIDESSIIYASNNKSFSNNIYDSKSFKENFIVQEAHNKAYPTQGEVNSTAPVIAPNQTLLSAHINSNYGSRAVSSMGNLNPRRISENALNVLQLEESRLKHNNVFGRNNGTRG